MDRGQIAESRATDGRAEFGSRRERAFGAAAVSTSVVVGTALTLINHPEVVWLGVAPDLAVPLVLNYLVPFLVAGYSRHKLLRRMRIHGRGS